MNILLLLLLLLLVLLLVLLVLLVLICAIGILGLFVFIFSKMIQRRKLAVTMHKCNLFRFQEKNSN